MNPTEKPVRMWRDFLKIVKADLVIDLFAGTCSLSLAAAISFIPFLAVEKHRQMVVDADKRLSAWIGQSAARGRYVRFSRVSYSKLAPEVDSCSEEEQDDEEAGADDDAENVADGQEVGEDDGDRQAVGENDDNDHDAVGGVENAAGNANGAVEGRDENAGDGDVQAVVGNGGSENQGAESLPVCAPAISEPAAQASPLPASSRSSSKRPRKRMQISDDEHGGSGAEDEGGNETMAEWAAGMGLKRKGTATAPSVSRPPVARMALLPVSSQSSRQLPRGGFH